MPLLNKQIHGTGTCYRATGCRCEKCVAANDKMCKTWRQRNREKYNTYMRNYRRSRNTAIALETPDNNGEKRLLT